MTNWLIPLRYLQPGNQIFGTVLARMQRDHDEQLDTIFIGTEDMKRIVDGGVGPSVVIMAEVRHSAT